MKYFDLVHPKQLGQRSKDLQCLRCNAGLETNIIRSITMKQQLTSNKIILMYNTPPAYVEACVKGYACCVTCQLV